MRIVELIIDEEAEMYGIDAISLVEQPAIESDFVALKNEQIQFKTLGFIITIKLVRLFWIVLYLFENVRKIDIVRVH